MDLQMFPDNADVTFSGRVFHSRAAGTGKARSPTGASDNKRWWRCRAETPQLINLMSKVSQQIQTSQHTREDIAHVDNTFGEGMTVTNRW